MPTEFRPARKAATSVEPVPAIGSRTVSPCLVKNSMNSWAMVSGNLAGCTSTPFLRGGGLWMNHDFWNFSQLLGSRLLSLLEGIPKLYRRDDPMEEYPGAFWSAVYNSHRTLQNLKM